MILQKLFQMKNTPYLLYLQLFIEGYREKLLSQIIIFFFLHLGLRI